MQVFGMSGRSVDHARVYETLAASPIEFGSNFALLGGKSPNAEMFLNGRWYPVTLNIQFLQHREHLSKAVVLQATLSLCDTLGKYSINSGHNLPVGRQTWRHLFQGFRRVDADADAPAIGAKADASRPAEAVELLHSGRRPFITGQTIVAHDDSFRVREPRKTQ
jgi:hypothetical protein